MMVDRELTRLAMEFPDIAVEKIDILRHPGDAWKEGIRMIPALKNKDRILSGFLPGNEEIRRFFEKAV